MNLKNKKILITGATGGIGNCLVKKFDDWVKYYCEEINEQKLEKIKKDFSGVHTEKFKLDQHNKIEEFIDKIDKKLEGLTS